MKAGDQVNAAITQGNLGPGVVVVNDRRVKGDLTRQDFAGGFENFAIVANAAAGMMAGFSGTAILIGIDWLTVLRISQSELLSGPFPLNRILLRSLGFKRSIWDAAKGAILLAQVGWALGASVEGILCRIEWKTRDTKKAQFEALSSADYLF
ncbi:MAG: hypothetical protein FWD68_11465 [Alphaproteobacteria bacterium]|nr:hypothetical protein [Alphaproteobacteria bacterium]